MYSWIDYTINFIKGACPIDCAYCYMKKWGKQNPVRLDEKEFTTDLGQNNIIFVGSSCDMFADDIPEDWIYRILAYLAGFNNRYLFQTKNPARFSKFSIIPFMYENGIFCTTIETNRHYEEMGNAPKPEERARETRKICERMPTYVTIEPIMDFDLGQFALMLFDIRPIQINIGSDSGGNNLPEPDSMKINDLINITGEFTNVVQKKNLKRLL